MCLVRTGTLLRGWSFALASHLSWVQGLDCITLHEEHIYKVDEDAGGMSGVLSRENQPLVEYHEHQVAKQAQQEQELRKKHQVQVVLFPKVPVFVDKNKAGYQKITFKKMKKKKNKKQKEKLVLTSDCKCWGWPQSSCVQHPVSLTSSSCKSLEMWGGWMPGSKSLWQKYDILCIIQWVVLIGKILFFSCTI